MLYTEYLHRLRLHEQASQDQPRAYRQRVLAFAALGYGLIGLLVLLCLSGLLWLGWMLVLNEADAWMLALGLACLGLLWATVRGLRVPFRVPEGLRLTAEEAPELFEGLERIRDKIKAPALHAILINEDFNATIVQRPHWLGLRDQSYLLIGWPLLAAMEPRRVFALLAHEYAHLRDADSQRSAWIYRSRAAWTGLLARYRGDRSPMAGFLGVFVRWYAPRFDAMSFALAREEELAADGAAARIFGPELVAQTLQEVAVKRRLYEEHFWRHWWRLARLRQGESPAAPHAQMASTLLHLSEPERLQQALREALRAADDPSDTHPLLKDRLSALGQRGTSLAPNSTRSALTLLGRARARIGEDLDARWWREHRKDWQGHGKRLRELHAEVRAFQARATVNDMVGVEDLLRWAAGLKALTERDPTPVLERALQLSPRNEQVLLSLVSHHAPLGTPQERVADWLERLHQEHPALAWRTACLARQWMDRCSDPAMLARLRPLWRERIARAEAMEQQAREQFAATPCWERNLPLALDEDALRRVKTLVLRQREVHVAWLVAQDILSQPSGAHFTLCLQCRPGVSAEGAAKLAQRLEETLDLPGRARVVLVGAQVERASVEQAEHLLTLVQRR